jgi:hypothetical protein
LTEAPCIRGGCRKDLICVEEELYRVATKPQTDKDQTAQRDHVWLKVGKQDRAFASRLMWRARVLSGPDILACDAGIGIDEWNARMTELRIQYPGRDIETTFSLPAGEAPGMAGGPSDE